MKIINKLLILILLTISIYANDIDNIDNENNNIKHNVSGKTSIIFCNIKNSYHTDKEYEEQMIYNDLQINYDYYNGDFYFQATPYMYVFETKSGESLYNSNFHEPYKKQDIYLRSLYSSYKVSRNSSVGLGILPFSNSNFLQYEKDYVNDGEGLTLLNDNSIFALFFKFRIYNTNIIFGAGIHDNNIPMGNYIDEVFRDGTKTGFLITKNKFGSKENIHFINQILYSDIKYEGEYDLAKMLLFGTGLAYDNSIDSGLVIYGNLGYSIYKNENLDSKDAIFENHNLPTGIDLIYPEHFAFNNETYTGAAHIIGIRKDFEFLKYESFLLLEWFHTYNDWVSVNHGSSYNNTCNNLYNVRNNAYLINIGIKPTSSTLIKLSYSYLEFNEEGKIGADMATIPVKDSLGSQRYKTELLRLKFSYKF